MGTLEIKNLKLGADKISLSIKPGMIVGVYSRNKPAVLLFLEQVSGINENGGTCFWDDKDLFDDPAYFRSRIFLDFSQPCPSTLRAGYLKERLESNYGLNFDSEKFAKLVRDLNIRQELLIDYRYHFSEMGNTLTNFAMMASLDKPNLIINNPTTGVTKNTAAEIIINELCDRQKYQTVILGLDNLKVFQNRLDLLILIGEEHSFVLDPKTDGLMAFRSNSERFKNRICSGAITVTMDGYSKEELKYFEKQQIEFQKISAFDLEVFR
jgi:ABC-type multidrug transport system ATPase subunit